MVGESSRVAAMVGFVGLVLGAVLGAFVNNQLERNREFELRIYERQTAAILDLLPGNDSPNGPYARANRNRQLIALTGNPDLMQAMRDWIRWEDRNPDKVANAVDLCRKDERKDIFLRIRRSLRLHQADSWTNWLGYAPQTVSDKQFWEVFARCLYK